MKLFNSFDEIVNDAKKIFSQINDEYLAHISENKKNETLKEHSLLVAAYLIKVVNANNVEPIVDNLIYALTEKINLRNRNQISLLIKQYFVSSIIYHDLGKINPNFQVDRMNNSTFEKQKLEIKHNHSFLGAFCFVNLFFSQILKSEDLDDEDCQVLYFILFLFSVVISKHHSSTFSIDFEFTPSVLEEAFRFLETYSIELEKDYSVGIFIDVRLINDTFNELSNEKYSFPLFALLKLSYSLLTACDYYATNEYMAGMVVDDFGILTPDLKEKIISNFKSEKDYNKDLIANFESYLDRPFSELQKQSKTNLNLLRQKLNAEVISTLRKNPASPWYYIEAPTGAGKTNLSLACISELLQIDRSLNKVFYVFPFTTLITQTFHGIQETIGLTNNEMIQLHSKAGFHEQEETTDGKYGDEKRIYLDNLFVNYPFCVTSHVRFFDVLKGNKKETNYLLHRLANSIVVIDELQTYNPSHWDKILFFIENYARLFNMRFIIMSATLPKIDALSETAKGKFVNLTPNKKHYFSNPNFAGRIDFDFSLLDLSKPTKENKEEFLVDLSSFLLEKAENFYNEYGFSKVLIEFITKNTASHFFRLLKENENFSDYHLYILSGDILEPRRKKVIKELKEQKYKKVILVSTQVVEAGVDIDMDLGFKDRSLLDSDEQLAGRINRNASKKGCTVFLFDCDRTSTIYGKDKRYKKQQSDKEVYNGFKDILLYKNFDILYNKVFEDSKKEDWTDAMKLDNYLINFERFDFHSIHNNFKLIEDNGSESVFIPIEIEIPEGYTNDELLKWGVLSSKNMLSGEKLFDRYISIIKNDDLDYNQKQIDIKKLTGLMSQFTISVYPNVIERIGGYFHYEKENFGYKYLLHNKCYKIEEGFDFEYELQDIIL